MKTVKEVFKKHLNLEQVGLLELATSKSKYINANAAERDLLQTFNDWQIDFFYALYKKENRKKFHFEDVKSSYFRGYGFIPVAFKKDFYKTLSEYDVRIDYVKQNGEKRTIYVDKTPLLDIENYPYTDDKYLYVKDAQDDKLKKLIIENILSIQKA